MNTNWICRPFFLQSVIPPHPMSSGLFSCRDAVVVQEHFHGHYDATFVLEDSMDNLPDVRSLRGVPGLALER